MLLSESQSSDFRIDRWGILGFSFFALLGVLFASYPVFVAALAACALFFLACWMLLRRWLESWQMVLLVALTMSVLLNYGFDNLVIPLGQFGIPVGEVMMMAALGMAMRKGRARGLGPVFRQTPMVCLLLLLVFSALHLAVDIPRYGAYAVRDSSMFLESFLFVLGLIWARRPGSTETLARWLMLLFFLNLVYCCMFPFAEQLQALSPVSGVFHPVPVFGNYQDISAWLVVGVPFCLWIAPTRLGLPLWICRVLAIAQLSTLGLLQARSMYLAILVLLVVLFLLHEGKKMKQLALTLPLALLALAAMIGVMAMLGIQLQGRVGPVDFSFLERHAGSLLSLAEDRSRGVMGQDVDREAWYAEVWRRSTASPANLIVGQGFGKALIDFTDPEGNPVREPHNSTLSVFERHGTVGLLFWLTFLFTVGKQFVTAIRRRFTSDDLAFQLTLLLFLYFLVALIQTSVQPALEFSHGAFPFYFLTGFGLGLIRWQKEQAPAVAPLDRQRAACAY